ncbi:hypothetical protein FRB90_006189 [Tulasnella sp. 427]|nr:hypothetical protein FRB90_006189 [Tulasnella sp. 427]
MQQAQPAPAAPQPPQPLIPTDIFDAQSQRFYALSAIFMLQFSLSLSMLVPSLPSFSGLMGNRGGPDISTEERRVWAHNVVDSEKHLLGQHTVKLSPISTAHLNPAHLPFCLSAPHNEVLVPVLLNNSHPSSVAYSISALGDKSPSKTFTLHSKELTKIEQRWRDYFHDASLTKPGRVDSDPYDDEYENDDYNLAKNDQASKKKGGIGRIMGSSEPASKKLPLSPLARRFYSTTLESTQSIMHISVTRPGVVRLVDVKASDNSGFRISGSSEVLVVACPTARFEVPKGLPAPKAKECAGAEKELAIVAEGVAPLKLTWHREIDGRRETFVAEGIEGNPDATNLPLSQNITIPVALSLSSLGRYRYGIDSLLDGAGNYFEPSMRPVGSAEHIARSVDVIGRSSATFKNCGLASPVDLRKGADATLALSLSKGDRIDAVKSVTVQYVPPIGFKASPYTKEYRPKSPTDAELPIVVRQPGTYTIMSVDGYECSGDVMSPEVCKVVEQPQPTADVSFETLHECSGDVGVKASLVLHGTPPYTIFYTESKNREHAREQQKRITSAREEIVFQPESSGTYTYTFTHVSDKFYSKVPLTGNGLSIKKIVHPLASADFVRPSPSRGQASTQMNSCSGKTVDFSVDLRGSAPWNLKLQVTGPSGSEIIEKVGLTDSRSRLSVDIPEDVDAEGGMFQIDLVSVVDTTRCERTLNVPGIPVNVQRLRPEVKFYSSDGQRRVTILEGQTASLPLRLTGQAPWSLTYRRTGEERTLSTTLRNPNDHLNVQKEGEYELIDIHDANCPGMVVPMERTYNVDWVPRPTVQFSGSAGLIAKNDSIVRSAVCEGTEDHAEIMLTGRAPFQIQYAYSTDSDRRPETITLSSVQTSARLQLRTSLGGHHRYQLLAVGDVHYPLKAGQPLQGNIVVKGQYLEQTVSTRPTAFFRSPSRLSYCVGNKLSARDAHGDGGIVVLNGQAPFHLTVAIKNFANNHVERRTIEVKEHSWKVDFPDYALKTIGPTLVTIESMKDSSPCPEADPTNLLRSVWIDVAETAAVVPLDRKQDYCVGEPISLQLEGTPPWTVHYSFNGKVREATSSFSKFSRVAVHEGTFKVLTIAHQRNMCQTQLENLEMTVHPIPSAKVSHGNAVEDNIREGDQASISFELLGTPPFTFTYQRTELMTSEKRGKPLQVLETHTVSGVTSNTYTISSSQEGTWTVTFIADKFCRYPTNPPDSTIESA